MAATRFYFPAEGSTAPNISPSFNAGWEQTGQANRLKLVYKRTVSAASTIADDSTRTVPITTTQDILCNQFVSDPIPAQRIIGTVSMVIKVAESALTANVSLCLVAYVVSQDGGTVRGTLFNTFNSDTEWPTSAATRLVSVNNVTATTTQPGDRIVVEIGGHAAAPTAATTYTIRQGNSAASDFALTTGLSTDLNPWIEFSQDMYAMNTNNFQFIKAGDGMSVSEKVR